MNLKITRYPENKAFSIGKSQTHYYMDIQIALGYLQNLGIFRVFPMRTPNVLWEGLCLVLKTTCIQQATAEFLISTLFLKRFSKLQSL